MSCSTLIKIYNKKHSHWKELNNAWGTSPVIWSCLIKKYFKRDGILFNKGENDIIYSLLTEKYEKTLYLFTCENNYIKRDNFERFAKDIDLFFKHNEYSVEYVNHWNAIREILLIKDGKKYGLGLHGTSVAGCPFCIDKNKYEIYESITKEEVK